MNESINIDQNTLDLLNRGIDDELSAAEQDELQELLASSAEARALNDELKSLTRLVTAVPELEPPAYLQESIERQIRLPHPGTAKGNEPGGIGAWFSVGWLRTGAMLTAGVILTVMIYQMGSGPISQEDVTNLVGTVVKNPVLEQGKLLDKVRVSESSLQGSVEIYQSGDRFALDIRLISDSPYVFALAFANQELDFEGLDGLQNNPDAVTVSDGEINVAVSDEQHYTMTLKRKAINRQLAPAPLSIAFYADNHLLKKVELSISDQ
jgi:hypothetical protein